MHVLDTVVTECLKAVPAWQAGHQNLTVLWLLAGASAES